MQVQSDEHLSGKTIRFTQSLEAPRPERVVLDELLASLDSGIPTFVLIDPILGEPPFVAGAIATASDINTSREKAWQRPVQPVELHRNTQLSPNLHPYLVLMKGPHDPLFETTLTLAQAERAEAIADGLEGSGMAAHRIGGWLQSSQRPQQLATHLSDMFRVKTEALTYATYLRLADRRVLALLRHVVGDERVVSQFGRLQRWIYLDTQGRVDNLSSRSETTSMLRLSKHEWLDMSQGEALHRTLAQWMGAVEQRDHIGLSHMSAIELFNPVRQAISAAQRASIKWPYRFPTLADQTVWAVLTLLYPKLENVEYASKVAAVMHHAPTQEEPAESLRYLYSEIAELMQKGTMVSSGSMQ